MLTTTTQSELKKNQWGIGEGVEYYNSRFEWHETIFCNVDTASTLVEEFCINYKYIRTDMAYTNTGSWRAIYKS